MGTAVQDINRLKRARDNLHNLVEKYRTYIDDSHVAITASDTKGILRFVNKAFCEITGYAENEILGKYFTELIQADNREGTLRVFQKTMTSPDRTSCFECNVNHKKGHVINIYASLIPLKHENDLLGALILITDITERKRIDKALEESETRLRLMFESVSDGIKVIDLNGVITDVNYKTVEIHGFKSKSELIGKNSFETIAQREREKLTLNMRRTSKYGASGPIEYSLLKADGSEFPGELSAGLLKDTAGNPVGFIVTVRDITERKQAEEELKKRERYSSSLLNYSPYPIMVINEDRSIQFVNPSLEKLTGYSAEEVVGTKPPYPWWPEALLKEHFTELLRATCYGTGKRDCFFQKKNGEQFWVDVVLNKMELNEYKQYVAYWVDITEQKRLRANMEFYIAHITTAQEGERLRVAREIHDDAIQSLSSLALEIDAINRERGRLGKSAIQRLENLRTMTNGVVDGLRRLSHRLRPGVIDHGLIPAVENLVEDINKEGSIEAQLQVNGLEQRLSPNIEIALFRITQEALRNVHKHSRATKVLVRLRFTSTKVRLIISDNGTGFEVPMVLSDLAANGKLGLIGMQEHAHLLESNLVVKSRVGIGTTIIVNVLTRKQPRLF